MNGAASANSYNYVKSIAEEIRQIAVEFDCAIVTATQTNRGGFKQNHNELDMTSTSESIGLPATVDSLIGIIQSEDMRTQGKIVFKNLKSRFDSNINEVVVTGIVYDNMRLRNLSKEEEKIPDDVKQQIKKEDELREAKVISDPWDFGGD